MGIKRIVDVQFWNDDKVLEHFSPEDKLFMLYLMTNPHTTQLGIYPINKKHMSFELGYTVDVINVLLDRFENKYRLIMYSNSTKEMAIKNYLRHSIIKGGAPVRDCLIKEIRNVKNKKLLNFVFSHLKQYELNQTVSNIISEYEKKNGELSYCNKKDNDNDNDNDNEVSYHDTSDDTSNDTLDDKNNEVDENKKLTEKDINFIPIIIEYMNNCGAIENFKIKKVFRFNSQAKSNKKAIKSVLNDRCYSLNDFKDVIFNAYSKFVENEYKGLNGKSSVQYYNPTTIFTSSKMEKYKNEYENM